MHKLINLRSTNIVQHIARVALGIFMLLAGIGHLTLQRLAFRAQVPNWIPIAKDLTVVVSGLVEIALGLAIIFWKKERIRVGIALALFYFLIFPGNIAQYLNHTNAFGLDTESKRLARLLFQPILIFWAIWSSGALSYLKLKIKGHSNQE